MTAPNEIAAPRRGRHLATATGLAVTIVGLDVVTKRLGEAKLDRGEPRWLIDGWVGLERTSNSGVAFGLLDGQRSVWVLLVVAIAVLGWMAHDVARDATSVASVLPMAAIAAGAAGNLIDRLGDGRVTDLIAFGPWPRFNIADSSLTIGLVLLLVQAATTKGHEPDDRRHDPALDPRPRDRR